MASRVLSALSTTLIVLLAVLTPVSAVAAWSDLEIGDTGRFVATMAPLDADPHVQRAVADRITDEVMAEVKVGPLQQAVRNLLHDAVLSFATTDAFKNAWRTAVRAAHSAAQQVLSSGGDTVTIDLAPITEEVKKQLMADNVPFSDRIPVRHADDITVLEANGLGVWRDVAQWLRAAGIWPAAGTVVAAVAAVLFAGRGGRARALIGVGSACAIGAGLLVVAVAVARGSILADLPDDGDRAAARAIYDALTMSLRTAAWSLLAAGLVLAVGTWATGRLRGTWHARTRSSGG
ncbi:hypothetical protein [Streptomyces corynorhini]|uniref:Integral membrane protein n=1 Tax=Streptomyces corynorhini TaxID=2282652 RepID=A0A370B709_9ACTN|nr:hypothetical protein [Streptomyces corynorhini]RDG35894.1 hypothetical protein DVH02_22850 [Streptomyces corynorhini]